MNLEAQFQCQKCEQSFPTLGDYNQHCWQKHRQKHWKGRLDIHPAHTLFRHLAEFTGLSPYRSHHD